MYMKNTEDYIATGVRLPPKMHKAIHVSAFHQNRTFNSMVITILERGMEKTELEEVMAEIQEIKKFSAEVRIFIQSLKPKEVRDTTLKIVPGSYSIGGNR